jgi:KUP system potassium uptake protein
MWIWYKGRKIKNRLTEFVPLKNYIPLLKELSNDTSISKYSTHLIYLTSADTLLEIESKVMYSILQKRPKKADIYWFVHVHVDDQPYKMEYKVDHIAENDIIKVEFKLGFRVEQKINLYFRKVIEEMVKRKEVDIRSRYESLNRQNVTGDFRFVVLERYLSNENNLPFWERITMEAYFFIKGFTSSEDKWFGLDTSNVKVEKVPLILRPIDNITLERED